MDSFAKRKKFNYGIYGIGRIGKVHTSILLDQGHRIIAIGDDKQAALSAAGEELDFTSIKTFNSPEAMLQSTADELEAVVIASLTKDHIRHILPFIKAQIPVYLEKPLSEGLDEAFEFVKSVGQDEHLVQIGLQRRYDPALFHVKTLLDKGLIGEIREIRCVLRDQNPPPENYISGGLIVDMGIHVADEAIYLLDEFPNEVWASVYHTKGYESSVQEEGDTAFVTFTTPSHVLGRLDLSRTHSSGYNNETYIIGTEGTLHCGRFAGYPGPINVELWNNDGTLHPASKSFDMSVLEGEYAEFLPRFDLAYREAHREFQKAIETGEPFRVTQNHILDAQVFVEAAHRSAQLDGSHFKTERFDNIDQYKFSCLLNVLIDSE